MPSPTHTPGSPPDIRPRTWHLGWLGLVLAAAVAYSDSFTGVFVFDDIPCIVENQTLHSLAGAWSPAAATGNTVDGRPLLNFSLALNYAISGINPWSYHAINLLIHILAGLALLGVIRRTLQLDWCQESWRQDAPYLAVAIALLWTVHPLQTSAVTYVVQRAESLAALFYLLTLLAFIRFATTAAGRRRWWGILAALACLAGMATKETMATAPLLVLAYDRFFLNPSWREAWRRNGRLHLALAATWALLFWLSFSSHFRGGTTGYAAGIWRYLLTQCDAIVHYLWLAAWPTPLVFDYGLGTVGGLAEVWPQASTVVVLLGATLFAICRTRPIGFVGAWFFLILAPSSSFVPVITQTVAEHRVYLPLAGLITLAVLAAHRWLGLRATLLLVLATTIAGTILTARRNLVYHSALALWTDTAHAVPANARAQLNLGAELYLSGRREDALARFREAVRLDPGYSDAHNNLANALKDAGRRQEAFTHYAEAARLDPTNTVALCNYAALLAKEGRLAEAELAYVTALHLGAAADVRTEWALILILQGRSTEAETALRAALRENPGLAAAQLGLGDLLARSGRGSEAEPFLREATRLNPRSTEAHNSLGYLLLLERRPAEAVPEFAAAIALSPANAALRANHAAALARLNRPAEARAEAIRALQLDPANALARALLSELPATQ